MKKSIYLEAVRNFGTPCYIFDLDLFCKRIAAAQNLLGNEAAVCFAMKANPYLTGAAAAQADYLEVCSPGELAVCERVGVPADKIVMSGVNKTEQEIRRAVESYGKKITYTVESMLHLERLQQAAEACGVRIPVLLRVTSGNQFGLSEELVKEIVGRRSQYSAIEIKGLQYFSGTQKRRIKVLEEELKYMDNLILELERTTGYETQVLEFGPGLYVEYFPKGEAVEDLALLQEFSELLRKMRFREKITLELGRYLAAFCGSYLTSVVDQKVNGDNRYCIVDGGIHQVNYYGQTMAMKIPMYRQLKADGEADLTDTEELWNICGSLCTINDIIVKKLPLKEAALRDVLVFENTGAYSVTEGMAMFLCRDLPKVLYYDEAHGLRLARDRVETNELLGKVLGL